MINFNFGIGIFVVFDILCLMFDLKLLCFMFM